jgi:hypothetical protein
MKMDLREVGLGGGGGSRVYTELIWLRIRTGDRLL